MLFSSKKQMISWYEHIYTKLILTTCHNWQIPDAVYTVGIPQRLVTDVHSSVATKTSTALSDSSGSDSAEITMCTLVSQRLQLTLLLHRFY